MDENTEILNNFLMDVFNEILKTEERCITENHFTNLSVKELHVIEAVCHAEDKDGDNCASALAKNLNITGGTLTTAVGALEHKGYLIRQRDSKDKWIVHISATESGRAANEAHKKFHHQMIEDILFVLDEEELPVFVKALGSIATFFKAKYGRKNISARSLIEELKHKD